MAGQSTPESWAVLNKAVGRLRRVVCYLLGRREGIVNKWMLQPPTDATNYESSGIPNPLDHVIAIYRIVASESQDRATEMMKWLAEQCDGRYTQQRRTRAVAPPQQQAETKQE